MPSQHASSRVPPKANEIMSRCKWHHSDPACDPNCYQTGLHSICGSGAELAAEQRESFDDRKSGRRWSVEVWCLMEIDGKWGHCGSLKTKCCFSAALKPDVWRTETSSTPLRSDTVYLSAPVITIHIYPRINRVYSSQSLPLIYTIYDWGILAINKKHFRLLGTNKWPILNSIPSLAFLN